MASITNIEKMLYPKKTPVVTEHKEKYYPLIEKPRYYAMRDLYRCDMDQVIAFAFYESDDFGKGFFDIYLFDALALDQECVRFIIQKDFYMSQEKEALFDYYCKHVDFRMSPVAHRTIKEVCDREYEDVHMEVYGFDSPGVMLQHLYYAINRTGVKEILYKAGLHVLAYFLDEEIEGINILGSTPAEILGLPIRLLNLMNRKEFLPFINTEEKREHAKKVFEKFHTYIKGDDLSVGQWMYLEHIWKANKPISAKKYDYLKEVISRKEYIKFKAYDKLRKRISSFWTLPQYPRNIEYYEREGLAAESYVNEDGKMHVAYRKVYEKNASRYEYADDNYKIIFPPSIWDLLKEAKKQKNCLVQYIQEVLNERCSILFMRRETEPKVPYITIEVQGNAIVQARGRFNRDLIEEEKEWIKKYAKKMKLKFSLGEEVIGL